MLITMRVITDLFQHPSSVSEVTPFRGDLTEQGANALKEANSRNTEASKQANGHREQSVTQP